MVGISFGHLPLLGLPAREREKRLRSVGKWSSSLSIPSLRIIPLLTLTPHSTGLDNHLALNLDILEGLFGQRSSRDMT
jgi:hypothetical protein